MKTLEYPQEVTSFTDIIHIYPRSWRTSGGRPSLGDTAHCGHVKQQPTVFHTNQAARASGHPYCVVCLDLAGRPAAVWE